MCCNHHSRLAHLLVGAMALTFTARSAPAQIEFGIPTPMPSVINEFITGYPHLTPNDLSMYFTAIRSDSTEGSLDLWITSRSSMTEMWQTPVNLGPLINTAAHEMGSSMTADGLELYFERTSNFLSHDDGEMWVSKRSSIDDPWGAPELLAYLNTPGRDGDPYISPDGLELYFDSNRDPNFPISGNLLNTYVARRTSRTEAFGAPEYFYISGIPHMSNDGLTYLMTSNDVVGKYDGDTTWYGSDDLYIRTRPSNAAEFAPGQNVRAPISTQGLDCCGDFSSDGSTIYFTSTRPGGPGPFNIWQAPLAKTVLVEINPGAGSDPIDWGIQDVLTVAILSQPGFDALAVDVATLRFGDPLLIADGASPVSPLVTASADVNGDGQLDLTIDISIPQMRSSGVAGRLTQEGYLAGALLDGSIIAGRDALAFVPEPTGLLLLIAGLALMPQRWRN